MYRRVWKRVLDAALAVTGLALGIVPMLFIALGIFLEDPGPVLFRQERAGRNGTRFEIYKFRTMRRDAPAQVPREQRGAPAGDVLRFGRFLRRYGLDELPQLANILRGDMSVVGPRPVIGLGPERVLVEERERLGAGCLRPGLTGLAQVSGRDTLDNREKARLDGEYARRVSFPLDCRIFLLTAARVLTHDGYLES